MSKFDENGKSMGILVCRKQHGFPFDYEKQFRRLSMKGKDFGIHVAVFFPDQILWDKKQGFGFEFNSEQMKWVETRLRLPLVIYDRFFSTDPSQKKLYAQTVKKLKKVKRVRFLNISLGDKWKNYCDLRKHPHLESYLPETSLLDQEHAWLQLLHEKQELFLKPKRGSQGKGTIYIRKEKDNHTSYYVRARDKENQNVTRHFNCDSKLKEWIQTLTLNQPYLVQPFLSLISTEEEAFDIRSLVQKNSQGSWEVTGFVVRKGQRDSMTSNLHGGGMAIETEPFLLRQFGKLKASQLLFEIKQLSQAIPEIIEAENGRQVELGIDFGIDRRGRLWILEVNSKPGRTAFSKLANKKQRYDSVYNPLFYARFLLEGAR